MVREKKNFSGSQNSKSNKSEILRKFFAKGKTDKGQGNALTGIRAAIYRHLTCAKNSSRQ